MGHTSMPNIAAGDFPVQRRIGRCRVAWLEVYKGLFWGTLPQNLHRASPLMLIF